MFALSGAMLAGDAARTALGNPETLLQPNRRRGACVPGSKVSLRQLLEHVDIQRLLSHELLQPLVLHLEALQPLRAPNKKRFWDAVVVDGVYGETFGQ
jgi:hypothetical protein